ncbi:MAG: Cation transport ATPase [Clostridiales bacterium]|jgi:copper chaperone CopZ|nr:Cation transport ATPase [Clostridiales bacterium]
MKKTYKLVDLDCANCAAKMEKAINDIEGVKAANISFMAQKLTIDAVDELFEDILKQAAKVCKKIEPDCKIKI